MRNSYPAISRLTLIIDYITGIRRTKRQIAQYLEENDFSVSDKTIERDINYLREWGYEIELHRNEYIRTRNQEFENELLKRLSEIVRLKEIVSQESELLEYVYDTSTEMRGIEYLTELFTALKQKRTVQFSYLKYDEKKASDRNVIPLWLKEGEGLWYLIGIDAEKNDVRTFGLDRMNELCILENYNDEIITEEFLEKIDSYKYMIGVSYPAFTPPEVELIQLGVSPHLLNYWKSKPVHLTQKITNEKIGDYTIVEFSLIPNIGLMKLIVSGMGDIKLIGPDKLKNFIKQEYGNLLKEILD